MIFIFKGGWHFSKAAGRQYLQISATALKMKGRSALRYFSGLCLFYDFQVTNSEEDKIQGKLSPGHSTICGGVLKKDILCCRPWTKNVQCYMKGKAFPERAVPFPYLGFFPRRVWFLTGNISVQWVTFVSKGSCLVNILWNCCGTTHRL